MRTGTRTIRCTLADRLARGARLSRFAGLLAISSGFVVSAGMARADELTPSSEPAAIIGGEASASCAWPSTVFIGNCTGTLIHPEVVVYAAHCGEPERVWFGEDVSEGDVAPGEGFSVETDYCMTNPDWDTPLGIGERRAADYAFCKLASPVLDVPIVPPLMGCETTVLTSGTDVTLVGFGGTDQDTFAVKFQVDTVLHYIDDYGVAVIGGAGKSPCAGDSGGPAFVQLPDGTWRAFGIVSGPNVGNCGDAMWFATIFSAIPFIEENSGIDVTACHHTHGQWNPSPDCGGFPLEPWDGVDKSWATGCGGGPISGSNDTCGAPFDATEDLVAPTTAIISPEDRSRFDTETDDDTYRLTVTAEASDAVSGVSKVELAAGGTIVEDSVQLGPPWEWNVRLPSGVWSLQSVATDWAGNEAWSEEVVIGIDRDPPPAPPPSTDTGDETTTGDEPDLDGTTTDAGTGDESTGGTGGQTTSESGCGCRSTAQPLGATWMLLGLLAFTRRRRSARRRAVLAVSVLAACSNDPSANVESETDTPTTTTTMTTVTATTAETSSSTSATADTTSGSSESSSEENACEPGTLDCTCTDAFTCDVGLSCYLNTCVECEAGKLTCPCRFDEGVRQGQCDEGLLCFGGLCASPQPCPFERNGVCDEPQGSGACLPGTDAFDCCPTRPGVCEEESQGGPCPDGSDPLDCGSETDTDTDTDTGTTGDTDTTGDTGEEPATSSTSN